MLLMSVQEVYEYLSEMDAFTLNEWAMNRLMLANPWIIRGDDMTAPIGLFKNGKEIKDKFSPIDNDLIVQYAVIANTLPLSLKQIAEDNLDDWKINQLFTPNNLVYFYTVNAWDFGAQIPVLFHNVGDMIRVTNNLDYEIYDVPFTEEMFGNQKIYVRYGTHEMTKQDALALV